MRQNVLDEIQKPLQKPRQTQVNKTYQIVRNPKTYQLYTFPDSKRYQLVYDKRVVDPISFQTYPYGYLWHPGHQKEHSYFKKEMELRNQPIQDRRTSCKRHEMFHDLGSMPTSGRL